MPLKAIQRQHNCSLYSEHTGQHQPLLIVHEPRMCCPSLPARLQVMADRLVEHFVSAGLMVREWDKVKLHGTVMNTLFRKDTTGRGLLLQFSTAL